MTPRRGGGGGSLLPPPPPPTRGALEGKAPQRWPQKRLDRRLEEVATAVGGGYCRLQMPLKVAFAVRETVAGRRLGAPRGGTSPLFNASLPPTPPSGSVSAALKEALPGDTVCKVTDASLTTARAVLGGSL